MAYQFNIEIIKNFLPALPFAGLRFIVLNFKVTFFPVAEMFYTNIN